MPEVNEYHIVSFVAQCPLDKCDEIQNLINAIEGGEVHAISPEGKMVFTVEGKNQKEIDAKTESIKFNNYVLSLAPVYHQFLDETESIS